jgi:hypothetical protein
MFYEKMMVKCSTTMWVGGYRYWKLSSKIEILWDKPDTKSTLMFNQTV